MNQDIVFTKTPDSLDRLKSRELHLSSKLKIVYLLIDGQSTLRQMHDKAKIFDDLEVHLEKLVNLGLIQVVNKDWGDINTDLITRNNSHRSLNSSARLEKIRALLIDSTILILGKKSVKPVQIIREAYLTRRDLNRAAHQSTKTVRSLKNDKMAWELSRKFAAIFARY